MWLRAAFAAGSSVIVLVACGGDGGAPSTTQAPQTASETNATEPVSGSGTTHAPAPGEGEEPKPPAIMTASPACAPVGSRVVLKLGQTNDRRSVDCYDVDDVLVQFAPGKGAKITVMGPMSDGYCAIDVEVPKGAETGKVRVSVGDDTFESESAFPVPCP